MGGGDKQWELISAIERHREAPSTFRIPPESVRTALQPGDLAKLLFALDEPEDAITLERMWVTVLEAENGRYVGSLESTPKTQIALSLGDRVTFFADHVAGVEDH